MSNISKHLKYLVSIIKHFVEDKLKGKAISCYEVGYLRINI